MPKALILVADGSEEIEFVTPYDVLTRAGFEVVSVGIQLDENVAHMSRNVRIIPDYPTLLALGYQTAHSNYDILILPGGAAGAKTFSTTDAVLELINEFNKEGKWVAAICAGTTALVAAQKKHGGEKAKVTSHPSVREQVEKEGGWEYSEDRVVVDQGKKVLTSRGPGTALSFALEIVEVLEGKAKREEVGGPMVLAEKL
ncbi:DJ-1 [Byssothecium circinans]|uniref:D-lactate dehydratase n=1 Tax=Byssothecium circinans TaxID=147558 RepID=A0A6A5UDF3_9PLEO|nr:DJ-1 [Byssothecium circinans]